MLGVKRLWPFGVLCFFISMLLSASANAACSAYQGKVVFNEVFDPSGSGTEFVEIKILDPGLAAATGNFSGWRVAAYKKTGAGATSLSTTNFGTLFASASNTCGQQSAWIKVPDSLLGNKINGSNPGSNLNFVLYEGGKIVDLMRLGTATTLYTPGTSFATCSTIESALPNAKYDASWGVIGNKDWYRDPDGTGNWGGQGTAANSDTTCGNNTDGGMFSLSKVPTLSTASTNTDFSFTLYAQNGATGSVLSNVQITDDLNTPGLTFVSCTTASGSCTEAGGVVTWDIGAFAAGVTKTAVLTVRAATAGLKTNTIVANVGSPQITASGAVQVNAPLADWHMDETGWNGSAGEVKDSSGNNYHGRARIAAGATSVPTTASGSPAYTSGSANTCAYGEFDRTTAPVRTYSYVELSGFPTLPSSFTFSAWIRSTNASAQHQRILVRDDADNGWGLSLADGTGQPRLRFFNRNITNSGAVSGSGSNPNCGVFCLDTNSVLTSNAWHYIAAAIDTVGKTVTLYVYDASGSLLATTSSAFTGTWADGTGLATIGGESSASSEGRQTSWHFLGNIDELQIFSGVLSQANIENLLTRTRVCSAAPPPVLPANFNCVESGADATTGHLYTKLAGTGFSFDVVALKTDGSVETTYASAANKNVTVELVEGSGATACAARTAISPAVSQTLAFTTLNQPTELGRKATASMTVNKAYGALRCRVTDANQSPSIVGCSADSFTVRPQSFDSVVSSANGDNAGTSASAATVVKAGASFSLTVGTGTVGYGGLPKVDASKIDWPGVPVGGRAAPGVGTLGGAFSTAADSSTGNGATGAAFNYSDVGYFRFQAQGIYDDTFAAQSADTTNSDCTNDFSNTLVGGKYGCKFGNTAVTNHFGRFIPDHFRVLSPVFAPGCSVGGFSYMDQPFALTATIEAQNLADARTQNYAGGFANGVVSVPMENADSGVPVVSARLGGQGTPAWAAGSYPFVATQFLKLAGGPDGAYDSLDIGLSVADEGALPAASRPYLMVRDMDASSTGCTIDNTGLSTASGVCSATKIVSAAKMRYGRVRLLNANGSNILDLPMGMRAEYWQSAANGWQTNAADSCTSATLAFAAVGAFNTSKTCVLDTGNPGASGQGCATASTATKQYLESGVAGFAGNFNLWLQAPGANFPGTMDVTATVPAWLQFNWTGTVGNPTARATFGVAKSGRVIHQREMY